LPGTEAAARSSLVICNGGSPTSQQALAAGVPVLGIAGNMDQFMNMVAVVRAGAGEMLRADRAGAQPLGAAVVRLLQQDHYRRQAGLLARSFTNPDSGQCFRDFVGQILGKKMAGTNPATLKA
jgi:UDP:flavonoid glycosyltransferase YjiC (YdhE family)